MDARLTVNRRFLYKVSLVLLKLASQDGAEQKPVRLTFAICNFEVDSAPSAIFADSRFNFPLKRSIVFLRYLYLV
jgi:hypothetical protein